MYAFIDGFYIYVCIYLYIIYLYIIYLYLTSAIDRGGWSIPRPCRFSPRIHLVEVWRISELDLTFRRRKRSLALPNHTRLFGLPTRNLFAILTATAGLSILRQYE